MAKKKDKKRKGILGQAVDALSSRDEEEKAKQAEKEAKAAEHEATLERAKREAAEAKARLIFVSPAISRLPPITPVHLSPMHRCILYSPLAETGDEQVIRSETSWNSKREG